MVYLPPGELMNAAGQPRARERNFNVVLVKTIYTFKYEPKSFSANHPTVIPHLARGDGCLNPFAKFYTACHVKI